MHSMALSFYSAQVINCGQIAEWNQVISSWIPCWWLPSKKRRHHIYTDENNWSMYARMTNTSYFFLFTGRFFLVPALNILSRNYKTNRQTTWYKAVKNQTTEPTFAVPNTTFLSHIYHLWLIVFCMENDNKTCTMQSTMEKWANPQRMCLMFRM